MIWNVMYTEQSRRDLKNIHEYIAYTLNVPSTAVKQTQRIIEAIDLLNDFPMRFPVYEYEPWRSQGLRMLPVNNYIVFYLPIEESHTISIIRIIYGGRNLNEQLGMN